MRFDRSLWCPKQGLRMFYPDGSHVMTWYHDEIRPSIKYDITFKDAFYRVKLSPSGDPVKRQVYMETPDGMVRVWDSRLVGNDYKEKLEHDPGCLKFPFADGSCTRKIVHPFKSRNVATGADEQRRVIISNLSEESMDGFGECGCFDWELRKRKGTGEVVVEKNRYYYSPSAGLVRVVRLFPHQADVTMRLG
jgi:hypothetical protein